MAEQAFRLKPFSATWKRSKSKICSLVGIFIGALQPLVVPRTSITWALSWNFVSSHGSRGRTHFLTTSEYSGDRNPFSRKISHYGCSLLCFSELALGKFSSLSLAPSLVRLTLVFGSVPQVSILRHNVGKYPSDERMDMASPALIPSSFGLMSSPGFPIFSQIGGELTSSQSALDNEETCSPRLDTISAAFMQKPLLFQLAGKCVLNVAHFLSSSFLTALRQFVYSRHPFFPHSVTSTPFGSFTIKWSLLSVDPPFFQPSLPSLNLPSRCGSSFTKCALILIAPDCPLYQLSDSRTASFYLSTVAFYGRLLSPMRATCLAFAEKLPPLPRTQLDRHHG